MDWNDLRFCLAVARAGSLAGAARTLGVNHSTIFRRLNAFEESLGVRVFERLPEGYVPSAEGEEILRHAEAAEAAVLALERTVAGKDFRLAGRIRLTTPANLAVRFVARYLPDFLDLYPDIRVEIVVGDRDFDLIRREADLALRATSQPPEYLVGRKVMALSWWVFAGQRYLARRARPKAMDELADHPLIGAEASFLRLPAFAALEAAYPESAFVARASDLGSMAALAEAGLGLALLPIDQQAPTLVPLFPVEPQPSSDLWLLTRPDLRHVARFRVFSDFLVERLRTDPGLQPPPAGD